MPSNYHIRAYEAGDEKRIVELLTKVFKGWPHIDTDLSPLEYWRWKYIENPLHWSYICVGEVDDKVIASHHNSVLDIKVMDNIIPGASGQDLAVHPDYRGGGLSSEVGDCTMRHREEGGVIFHYFITRNPILIRRYASSKDPGKRRKRFPFELSNLTRIRDMDLNFKHLTVENKPFIRLGAKALKIWNRVSRRPLPAYGLQVSEVDRFDDEMNDFLETVTGDHNFMVVRSVPYLNWKYAYPGLSGFKKHVVKDSDGIQGYSVLRVNRHNAAYPLGYIVDLVVRKGRLDAASILAAEAVQYFDSEDVNIINYLTVKGHPYIKVLEGHGFLDSRVQINLYTSGEKRSRFESLSQTSAHPSTILVAWGDHDALPVGLDPHT